MMPPKMFTSTALTFLSSSRMRKASVTCSTLAPPPTSRKFAGSLPSQAARGTKLLAEDLFRRRGGDLFDVHAAGATDHQHRGHRGPIDDDAQVQLAGNVAAGLDEHLPHRLPLRTGLNCHQ